MEERLTTKKCSEKLYLVGQVVLRGLCPPTLPINQSQPQQSILEISLESDVRNPEEFETEKEAFGDLQAREKWKCPEVVQFLFVNFFKTEKVLEAFATI